MKGLIRPFKSLIRPLKDLIIIRKEPHRVLLKIRALNKNKNQGLLKMKAFKKKGLLKIWPFKIRPLKKGFLQRKITALAAACKRRQRRPRA